jgi:hypothetical protein
MQQSTKIQKQSLRRLDRSIVEQQVNYIITRMLASGRGNNWSCDAVYHNPTNGNGYTYTCTLTFIRIGRDAPEQTKTQQIAEMKRLGQQAGNASSWVFDEEVELVKDPVKDAVKAETPKPANKGYYEGPLSLELGDHFSHIFEREPQIQIIQSALRAFQQSHYENRFNCLLWGEPGCGKTEIIRSYKRLLGNNAYLEFDATSTTSAGAIKSLLESEKLPPVLFIEELEKCDVASIRWLMSVLDSRGEIRKTTYRGSDQRNIKMFCICTVNDLDKFEKTEGGALASRFSNKIYCPRPSKAALQKILTREVQKVDGNVSWVDPAINYCVDVEGINDPRRVITVCLCGADALLDGSYQKALEATRKV